MEKLLIKHEEETSPNYGKLPSGRSIHELLDNGLVIIDKPDGPTSFQVTECVKEILHVSKTGHAGTLDPCVSGVLVVGLGKGTRILKTQLLFPKEYICLMTLHAAAKKQEIKKILDEFTGKLFQRPPIKAAVKRELRIREVYSINLLEVSGKSVLFKISCEAGTYIRRICHDIGLAFGTGAHMQQLRRTKSADFDESEAVTLHDLADAYAFWQKEKNEKCLHKIIKPVEAGLRHLPAISISDFAVDSLAHGAQLAVPGILKLSPAIKVGDIVAVFTQKGEAVMIGKALMDSKEILEAKKGIAVKTERILIEPGVYPKFKKD